MTPIDIINISDDPESGQKRKVFINRLVFAGNFVEVQYTVATFKNEAGAYGAQIKKYDYNDTYNTVGHFINTLNSNSFTTPADPNNLPAGVVPEVQYIQSLAVYTNMVTGLKSHLNKAYQAGLVKLENPS